MATVGQLEKKLRDSITGRRSPRTVDNYVWHLRDLVQHTGKTEWDRQDLLQYFKRIQSNSKPKSIWQYYYAIKSILRIVDLSFDMTTDDMPKGRPYAVNQFTVTSPDISHLIEYSRSSRGEPQERFFLAVSTTYGLRRIEMARLSTASIDLSNGTISIDTAKHNRPRRHSIPSQIVPYIQGMDLASLPIPDYQLSYLWNRLCKGAGHSTPSGEGWHAVRRSLVTELVGAGFQETEILDFMGWTRPTNMVAAYYSASLANLDRKIFANHPYLEMWE